MKTNTRIALIVLVSVVTGAGVWALLHFTAPKRPGQSANYAANFANGADGDLWAQAVEKVKADRGDQAGGDVALDIPAELRHYEDRHWFLATQVAEVRKHNLQTCQDFVDLAAMIERGEIVLVPAVTDTYVLFGVGAKADDDAFTRFEDDHSIGLYSEASLRNEYARIDATRTDLRNEMANLKPRLGAPKKRDRAKQSELQKQIATRQQELKSADDEKALLDQFYGQPDSRQRLFRDYESLQSLAQSFGGRSYEIDNPADRQAMKITMLRSLRPEALKVLEEIAADYHRQFDRPLPVSSLIRPEQYQQALHKVNRNAVIIDTPPHSTGLAFDIDYRYMGAAEQNFLMAELARMKENGRVEVLRERNANYHVFVFIDGTRPNDDLIKAAVDEISSPVPEANHAAKKTAKTKSKPAKAKPSRAKKRRSRR